jgi:NADPH-dependent ferric siderophore reductase
VTWAAAARPGRALEIPAPRGRACETMRSHGMSFAVCAASPASNRRALETPGRERSGGFLP